MDGKVSSPGPGAPCMAGVPPGHQGPSLSRAERQSWAQDFAVVESRDPDFLDREGSEFQTSCAHRDRLPSSVACRSLAVLQSSAFKDPQSRSFAAEGAVGQRISATGVRSAHHDCGHELDDPGRP
jgi:hypothetical protein